MRKDKIYKYLKENKYSNSDAIYKAMDDINHFIQWIRDNSIEKEDMSHIKELLKAHGILRKIEGYFREKYMEFR